MYGSEVNLSDPVRMTEEQKTMVQDFNCGNEVINSYLKEKAVELSTRVDIGGDIG